MAITSLTPGAVAAASAGSISPALPSGLQVNDVIIAVLESNDNNAVTVPTANAGGTWTKALEINSGTGLRLTCAWIRYNGTNPNIAFTKSGTVAFSGRLMAFRGLVTSGNPYGATSSLAKTTASTTLTSTAITISDARNGLLFLGGATIDASSTASFSSWTSANKGTLTELVDNASNTGSGTAIGAAWKGAVGTGSTGTTTATMTSAVSAGFLVELIAADVAGAVAMTATATFMPRGNIFTTKLYLPSTGAAPVTVTQDSRWTHIGAAVKRKAVATRINSARTLVSGGFVADSPSSEVMLFQHISDALAAQTLPTQWALAIQPSVSDSAAAAALQLVLRVVSNDGATVRGTIYAGQNVATGNYGNGVAGDAVPQSTNAMRSLVINGNQITCQTGDRLVIEGGLRVTAEDLSAYNGDVYLQDDSAGDFDIDTNYGATGPGNVWIGTTRPINFGPPTQDGLAALTATATFGATPAATLKNDDFNRTDSTTIGAVDATQTLAAGSGAGVSGNQLYNAAGSTQLLRYNTGVGTGKQFSELIWSSIETGISVFTGPAVLMPPVNGLTVTTAGSFYHMSVSGTGQTALSIRKKSAGSSTTTGLGANVTIPAVVAGDRLRLEYQTPDAPYTSTVLNDSPRVYYRLNETSGLAIVDSSGNGYDGALSATTLRSYAGALATDSDVATYFQSGPYVASATLPDISAGASITLAGWVRLEATPAARHYSFMGIGSSSATRVTMVARRNATGNRFAVWDSTNGWRESTVTITPDEWHHIACVFSGSDVAFYVDGGLTNVVTTGPLPALAAPKLSVAANHAFAGATDVLTGGIDEIAYFPVALSAATISRHAVNGQDGTLVGYVNGVELIRRIPAQLAAGLDESANRDVGVYLGGNTPAGRWDNWSGGPIVAATTVSGLADFVATATLTTAGAIQQDAAVAMTATATLATPGTIQKPGAVAMTAAATLTTAGAASKAGAVAMVAASSFTAAGVAQREATAALVATATFAAVGVRTQPAAVAMIAAATMGITGVRTGVAAVAMSATATMAIAGVREPVGVVAMSAAATMGITGVRTGVAAVAMTATATLTTLAVREQLGVVSMSAASTLTIAGVREVVGAVAMSAVGTLATAGVREPVGAVAMSATALFAAIEGINLFPPATATATGAVQSVNFQNNGVGGTASVDSNSMLTGVQSYKVVGGAGVVAGTGIILYEAAVSPGQTITVRANARQTVGTQQLRMVISWRQADNSAISETNTPFAVGDSPTVIHHSATAPALTAKAYVKVYWAGTPSPGDTFYVDDIYGALTVVVDGAATFTATHTLTAAAAVVKVGAAALSASHTMTIAGVISRVGTVAMTAGATLTIAGVVTKVSLVSMTSVATFTAAAVVTKVSLVSMTAVATFVAPGVIAKNGAVAFTAVSTFTVAGVRTVIGLVAMSGTGTMSIGGVRAVIGLVAMTALHAFAAAATNFISQAWVRDPATGEFILTEVWVRSAGVFKGATVQVRPTPGAPFRPI